MKIFLKFLVVAIAAASYGASAFSADLSHQGCCSDLEDRIAELEATVAKKGNRKVSLTVYGQISKSIVFWDDGLTGNSDQRVSENSAAESFVGFVGSAKISDRWAAGYSLKIGVGGYDVSGLPIPGSPILNTDNNGVYTYESALWLEGPVGRGTIGLASQATDGVAETAIANTAVVARMLSLRPLFGPNTGEVFDIFDGTRGDIVRYDTPVMSGFRGSASWAAGITGSDDVWDAALRYAGEFSGFQVAAAVGYRDGTVIPGVAAISGVQTISGSASVKHVASGFFVNAAAGQVEVDGSSVDLTAWHVQAGIESKFSNLGNSTFFAEYAEMDVSGSSPTLWGLGFVQAIDSAGMDLYLNARWLDSDGGDEAIVGQGGARIRF